MKVTFGDYTIEVRAWSGNVHPWAATVYIGEGESRRWVGSTGHCKTPNRAKDAALKLVASHIKKQSQAKI